ncbi:hypothetical protein BLA29_014731, partial [Euroglyphus maynei]
MSSSTVDNVDGELEIFTQQQQQPKHVVLKTTNCDNCHQKKHLNSNYKCHLSLSSSSHEDGDDDDDYQIPKLPFTMNKNN